MGECRFERPAALLHALAGSPAMTGCDDLSSARCRVCAEETTRAANYARWQGTDFTDQNKLRYQAGTVVCEPCVWAHSWTPPPGYQRDKDGRGVNLRLFSHFWCEQTGYWYANKADKPAIREWLLTPRRGAWWACIADTGQKHVLPWARVQYGPRGLVRFEERDVRVPSRALIDDLIELLTAGATKAEIEAGEYRPQTWIRCENMVRSFERAHAEQRGGGTFALALWLAQRDEERVAARLAAEKEAKRGRGKTRQVDRRGGGLPADGARRVPGGRSERAQALAADPRPSAARDTHERADQRVDVERGPRAPARQPEQQPLFGDAGAD